MTVKALISLAYASLVLELVVFHVPSVASTVRIFAPAGELVAVYSARYRRLFLLKAWPKLALFAVPLLAVYAVYVYPLVVISYRPDPLGDYLFTPTRLSDGLGVAAILAGRVIAMAAALTVRRENAQIGNAFRLHTSGVFGWSRNPGLVGMYLFVIGVWATMPAASLLAGILLYMAFMDFKVRMEEDFLRNKFGDRYIDYQARTGRYFR